MSRAKALPPRERRAAIVSATLELVDRIGAVPSTKEIADAAGVAEGTVFRAFESKERLLEAVVAEVFCPAPMAAEIDNIDAALPLRERLVALVTVMQHRFTEIFHVMEALKLTSPPPDTFAQHGGCSPTLGHLAPDEQDPAAPQTDWTASRHRLLAFIEPDADQLSCSVEDLAHYLRLLTFSGSHVHIADGRTLKPAEIVDLVLDGVRRPVPAHGAGPPPTATGVRVVPPGHPDRLDPAEPAPAGRVSSRTTAPTTARTTAPTAP